MIEDLFKQVELRMKKAIEALKFNLSKIRTGRASPEVLSEVQVEYYGNMTPIHQVASIVVEESHILKISPWEKAIISDIERAILESNIGLNPAIQGDFIRIIFPPLNEQRRKELVKLAAQEIEEIKISVRGIRRDAIDKVKKMVKEKEVSEDDEKKFKHRIEIVTTKYITEGEVLLSNKEKDLLTL